MKHRLKVVLTHDVDRIDKTFQYLTHCKSNLQQISSRDFRSWLNNFFNRNVYFMIKDVLQIEEKLGVKSTFFFLHETMPFDLLKKSNWPLSLGYYSLNDARLKNIYPSILSGGWEIGLHGSFLSYKDAGLLAKEKELLEQNIESSVYGVRQHFLNLTENTWVNQEKAGFKYDASWGHTRTIGFKDNIYKEFNPLENKNFKVVPLALMDYCVMQLKDYVPKVVDIIEECIYNDGVLVINWHQRTFNEFEFPNYRKTYKEIVQLCKSYNASFYTLIDYLNREKVSRPEKTRDIKLS